MKLLLKLLFLCLLPLSVKAADLPPQTYIDQGACPYECCTYRNWEVIKKTHVVEQVNSDKVIQSLLPGDTVKAITGEVHSIPLKIKLKNNEEIYLLSYEGEGQWKIWKNGEIVENFEQHFALNQKFQSTWWVRVKLPNGKTGWVKNAKDFFLDPRGCNDELETPKMNNCSLSDLGINNIKELTDFYEKLKKAAQSKKLSEWAPLVHFPLKINSKEKHVLNSVSELEKYSDVFFHPTLIDAVLNQKTEDTFCNYQGGRIQQGNLWFIAKKGKLGIISVNQ